MNENGIINLFTNLLTILEDDHLYLSISFLEETLLITQSLRAKITLKSLKNFKIETFFEHKNMKFFLNNEDSEILSSKSLHEKVSELNKESYSDNDRIDIRIVFVQSYNIPFENKISILCLKKEICAELISNLLEQLKIKDVGYLTHKIKIHNNIISNTQSSFFDISNNNEFEKLENEIIEFLNCPVIQENTIKQIPYIVHHIADVEKDILKSCLFKTLELLSDYSNEESFQIYKKKLKKITYSDYSDNFFDCYTLVCQTILFIFGNSKNRTEKLTISKSIIYEVMPENSIDFFSIKLWKFIISESENEYNLFVDDKVSEFIKERKEIIKEQFNLSNQINSQVNDLKKNLVSNLMTVIGLFLSKFFIDVFSKDNTTYANTSYLLGACFSIYLILSYFLSGENKLHEKFELKIEIMNEYYPKLYLTNDNIIDELDKKIATPEINELKKVSYFCGTIYFFLTLYFIFKLAGGTWDILIDKILNPQLYYFLLIA